MQLRFLTISALLASAIGLFVYSNATRTTPANTSVGDEAANTPFATATETKVRTEQPTPEATPETANALSAENVEEWIADAAHQDPAKRSAAIIALARAPKEQAVPVLRNALEIGDESDRQLALRALHTIAIEQGDEDGQIRSALRDAIYHSDDDGVSQSAQGYLEDLDTIL